MKQLPFHRTFALSGLSALALTLGAQAQIVLSDFETPYVQNFDSMGIPTGTATQRSDLPANWKVDRLGVEGDVKVRTLGTWTAAENQTLRNGGENINRSSIYNFGKPNNSAADRAIGFYGNSAGVHSGNLYAQFENQTGSALQTVSLTYDVQTFRDGTADGGTRIALYYSRDGVLWTSAGDDFVTVFIGTTTDDDYTTFPGASVTVAHTLRMDVPVADGEVFYLAWNYSNTTAAGPSGAHALGIDNFSVVAIPEPSAALILLPAAGAWLAFRKRRKAGIKPL